jgi:hypothetical protein
MIGNGIVALLILSSARSAVRSRAIKRAGISTFFPGIITSILSFSFRICADVRRKPFFVIEKAVPVVIIDLGVSCAPLVLLKQHINKNITE